MTDQKFIDQVYDIAFGIDARTRLPKDSAYQHEEVIEQLKEFSDKALYRDEIRSSISDLYTLSEEKAG